MLAAAVPDWSRTGNPDSVTRPLAPSNGDEKIVVKTQPLNTAIDRCNANIKLSAKRFLMLSKGRIKLLAIARGLLMLEA